MKDFDLEKEIKVVINVIRLLKDCLAISMKHRRKEECKRTIKDLKQCEIELQRLLEIREAKKNDIDTGQEEKEKENEAV